MTQPAAPAPRTVVIAEDEVLIRMDLAEMLGEEGYDVVGQADRAAEQLGQSRRDRSHRELGLHLALRP
ncbi:MAG: hypothetical protein ACPF9W_03905, partial [Nocardioides sp.]